MLVLIPLGLDVIEPLGRLIARPWADDVTGMQVDSRRIEEGDLFVAVGGGDGLRRARARARRGGGARAGRRDRGARRDRRRRARRARSARVVGDHRLDRARRRRRTSSPRSARRTAGRSRTRANYNNEIGVPLTLCRLEADTEICISEMGMRGLGQIAWLASFVTARTSA